MRCKAVQCTAHLLLLLSLCYDYALAQAVKTKGNKRTKSGNGETTDGYKKSTRKHDTHQHHCYCVRPDPKPVNVLSYTYNIATTPVTTNKLSEARSSVIDKLEELEFTNDFTSRLLTEEADDNSSASKSSHSPSWQSLANPGVLAVSLVLAGTMIAFSPDVTLMYNDLSIAATSAISLLWLPFLWARPGRLLSVTDMVFYLQVFARSDTVVFLKRYIWPVTKKMFKRAVTTELWSMFWSAMWKKAGSLSSLYEVVAESFDGNEEEKADDANPVELPPWMSTAQVFITKTVERNSRKVLQKAVQKHVQTSLSSLVGITSSVIKGQLQMYTLK